MIAHTGIASLLAALVGGCSAFGLLNTAGRLAGPTVAVSRNIAYGLGDRRSLDVYVPSSPRETRPIVVFFYGGGWDSGAKADYAWVGRALAGQGYVAVVPDYRIYPGAVWPDFLKDSAEATRWARDHGREFGGDPARLILMGHSAGAYNAVELAVDRRWLDAVGMDPGRDIAGVIGLSGPYDFLPLHSDALKAIFGPESQRPDTQPINHVAPGAPPMLLITGDKDKTVSPGNTDRMAAKLAAAGGQVRDVHYPGLDHTRTLGALSPPLRWMAPIMGEIQAFIDLRSDRISTK